MPKPATTEKRERAQRVSQQNGASAPARASEAVGESEGRSPSENLVAGARNPLNLEFSWSAA